MNENQMRLIEAGSREWDGAQALLKKGSFPQGVDFQTLLDHAIYDASTDEIVLTIKATVYRHKVDRP